MSVRTKAYGTVILIAGVYTLATFKPWREQPAQQPPPMGRTVPVLLVATWQSARDFRITWTADGRKPPAEVDRVSPYEREIQATPGSVVTFTVQPLIGGPGEHTCQIEEPPGVPRPGHAQQRGGGTTPIMCTHTVGS